MDYEATIRLTVKARFKAAGATDEERIAAARHAETELAQKAARKFGGRGYEIVSVTVEEVAEC